MSVFLQRAGLLSSVILSEETPVTHRYWRIYISGPMSGQFLGVAEIEFRGTIGGADQTGSGTAIRSSQYNINYPALYAFDDSYIDSGGSPEDIWVCGQNAFPGWIGYDFGDGNGVDVVEVLCTGREVSRVNESPGGAVIEWSDDGSVWEESWAPGAQSTWTDIEQRIWTKP